MGPGDFHLSASSVLDLPELPDLREQHNLQVSIEQYVTSTAIHQPLISLCQRDDDPDRETFTLEEAEALAVALTQAVATVRNAQARRRPHT
jgi:hypothetical protein